MDNINQMYNESYNEFYNVLKDIIQILNGDEKCKDCENVSFIKTKFDYYFEFMKDKINITLEMKKISFNEVYETTDNFMNELQRYSGMYYCCDRCEFRYMCLLFGGGQLSHLKSKIPDLFIIDI